MDIELRGDDLKIINEIKKYVPVNREDIWSWLCYIQNSIKDDDTKGYYHECQKCGKPMHDKLLDGDMVNGYCWDCIDEMAEY